MARETGALIPPGRLPEDSTNERTLASLEALGKREDNMRTETRLSMTVSRAFS